ncbi:MAG TPA: AsmA family protein, partial [Longimicrobiales bacterium]|nr:AsmA family protein [Longimicrobiales bacterium]
MAVLVLVGAYATVAVALHALVSPGEVEDWLAPRLSAALGREVSVGGGRISVVPRPSVRLSDVRVANLPAFEGPPILHVEEMRLELAWLALLTGDLRVRSVRLDEPRLYLAIDDRGVSNFGDLVPEGEARSDGSAPSPRDGSVSALHGLAARSAEIGRAMAVPVEIIPERVVVADGNVTWYDGPGARSWATTGTDARITWTREPTGGWSARAELRADSVAVRAPAWSDAIVWSAGPSARLDLRGDPRGGRVEVEGGFLALGADTLHAGGELVGLTQGSPSWELRLDNAALPGALLEAAFPPRLRERLAPRAAGSLDVALRIRGAAGAPPALEGAVRLAGGRLDLAEAALLEGTTGVLRLTRDSLVLDSVAGSLGGAPFALAARLERGSGGLELRASARPDLGALGALPLLPEGAQLSGSAELELAASRPPAPEGAAAGAPEAAPVAVDGALAVHDLQALLPDVALPLRVPAAELALADGRATWNGVTVLLGADSLRTSGTLVAPEGGVGAWLRGEALPEIDADLTGARLDLGALPPLRPASLPARGTLAVRLDTLARGVHALTSVFARVLLSDSMLSVPEAAFQAWGGSAEATLSLRTGASRLP